MQQGSRNIAASGEIFISNNKKKALPPPWDERLVILTQFHRYVTASASLSPNRL